MIENRFFPTVPGRPGPTITARDPVHERTVLVRDPTPVTSMSGLPVFDETLITDIINVACKAEGLPRANIEWNVEDRGGTPFDQIRNRSDNIIIVPRPGRSIYSVNVSETSATYLFNCLGTNDGGEANGQALVSLECE